jgi:hypothetical protein
MTQKNKHAVFKENVRKGRNVRWKRKDFIKPKKYSDDYLQCTEMFQERLAGKHNVVLVSKIPKQRVGYGL